MLEDRTRTDDQFRVDVMGYRRHEHKEAQGKPLLILEDLNPSFFSDQTTESVFETGGKIGGEEMMEAQREFGVEALEFFKTLARTCNAHGFVVIVTTMYRRVAKFLHKAVNGGEKFKISESLMCEQYNGKAFTYSAEIFLFEKHFVGLWNDASKYETLLQIFPDCTEDIITLTDELPEASLRSYCHILARIRAKKSPGTSPSDQQSNSPDFKKRTVDTAARCCLTLFLGMQTNGKSKIIPHVVYKQCPK